MASPGAFPELGTAILRIEAPFSMSRTSAEAPPLVREPPGACPGGLGQRPAKITTERSAANGLGPAATIAVWGCA